MIKKLIILLLPLSCLGFILFSCHARKECTQFLNGLTVEAEDSLSYVCFDTLYHEGNTYYFPDLLKKEKVKGDFNAVYRIKEGRIWFMFSQLAPEGGQIWNIASITTEKADFKIHYSGSFCMSEQAESYYPYSNDGTEDYYSKVPGYYHEGKIVMTDREKLIEFDPETETATEFSAAEYTFPSNEVTIDIQDFRKIIVSTAEQTKILDADDSAPKGKSFEKLLQYGKIEYLFDVVQEIDGKIYVFCRVLNKVGETHMAVFQYQFDSNTLEFAFHHFSNDSVSNSRMYLVVTE